MMDIIIPGFKDEQTSILIPEVSKRDEIKTCEYGMAVIEMLVLVGILVESSNDNGTIMWKTSPDYEERMLFLFVDGLSFDRHRYFVKQLTKIEATFLDNHKQCIEFQKALSRVKEVSGPLHIAFHMLQVIFNVYHKDTLTYHLLVQI